MDDDGALECLRRKMITGRHQPNDKLEEDSQEPIFNLCEAEIHALGRLKHSAQRSILQPDQGTVLLRRTH